MSLLRRIDQGQDPPDVRDRASLRAWWHNLLREYGQRYSCAAIFLVLPADRETIRYLIDFGNELDSISGDDCLVIALGKGEFRRSGYDKRLQGPSAAERIVSFLDEKWNAAIHEQVSKGYSVKIAQFFNVSISDFPALLIFRDIRSPSHLSITLKGMTAREIAGRMRSIFSIIHEAITQQADPLDALEKFQSMEAFQNKGRTILHKVTGLAEKTFETAMEAWINASLK